MDSNPPLNLTTVKIKEYSVSNASLKEVNFVGDHTSSIIEDVSHQIFLQDGNENKDDVAYTITGEPVIEGSARTDDLEFSEDEITTDLKEKELPNIKCTSCDQTFVRASQLRLHEKEHKEKVHSCEVCSETFPRLSLLLRHSQSHMKRRYSCSECGISLASYSKLRNHMKFNCGDKKFLCTVCGISFSQQCHLITHTRTHTGEKPFECKVCHSRFKQISHLTTHLRTHTKVKPYTCEFCNTAFSQTGSLKRHMRSHTGEKPFECNICGTAFVEKRNLTRHMLSHTGVKPFKCDICSSSFAQLIDLKRHTYSHSGYKPFKCNVCGAAFSRQNNLKWHKLTHEGDTPHKCDICNVGFKVGRDLKNHKRCHVESKPYPCNECNASFFQITTLKRHKLIHTGLKPFSCEICSATFYEKGSLKRHTLRHLSPKSVCTYCQAPFGDFNSLRRHMVNMHKEEANSNNINSKKCESPKLHISNMISSRGNEMQESLYAKENVLHESSENVGLSASSNGNKNEANSVQSECQVVMSETVGENGVPVPTLLLTQPGQPQKTAKPAGDCQNHHAHIHTLVEGGNGQWQTWCFCDVPNVPVENQLSSQNDSAMEQPYQCNTNYDQSNTLTVNTMQSDMYRNSDRVVSSNVLESQNMNKNSNSINQFVTSEAYLLDNPVTNNSSYGDYKMHYTSRPSDSTLAHHKEQLVLSEHMPNNKQFETFESHQMSNRKKYVVESGETPVPESLYYSQNIDHSGQEKNTNYGPVIVEMKKENQLISSEVKDGSHSGNPVMHQSFIDKIGAFDTQFRSSVPSVNLQLNTSVAQSSGVLHPKALDPPSERIQLKNNDLIAQAVSSINKDKEIVDFSVSHDQFSGVQVRAESTNHLPPYQMGVYENVPPNDQPTQIELDKNNVSVQYSLTVNNPTTGEIQIQSDVFPANSIKTESAVASRPIKKRSISKSGKSVKVKRFACSECLKSFDSRRRLSVHVKKHYRERPYLCGVCNLTFVHLNNLTTHMRSHTGEKPFPCTQCNTSFTQKCNLIVHMRIHTGEKPFKCDVCEASFVQSSHLSAHRRIHNNERPFACENCGQAFTQRSALKRHQTKHTLLRNCKASVRKTPTEKLPENTELHSSNESFKPQVPENSSRIKVVRRKASKPLELTDSLKQVKSEVNAGEYSESSDIKDNISEKQSDTTSGPIRASRRVRAAAVKKKSKYNCPDFITGDLDEIDKMEELEDRLHAERMEKKKSKIKIKEEPQPVQSWCFCEVPHRPDEPHTSTTGPTFAPDTQTTCTSSQIIADPASSNIVINNPNPREEEVLQFAFPQFSQTVVLQDHISQSSQVFNGDSVVMSAVNSNNSHGVISTSSQPSENHYLTSNQIEINQDGSSQVQEKNFASAQIISGHLLPNTQFLTSEGTYFIEAGELINGTVVLNSGSAANALFLDISGTDGQLVNLNGESVIVATSTAGGSSTGNIVPLHTSTNLPNQPGAVSFVPKNPHAETTTSQPPEVLSSSLGDNQNMLVSTPQLIAPSMEEGRTILGIDHSHFTDMDNSTIGLLGSELPEYTSVPSTSTCVLSAEKPVERHSNRSLVTGPTKCSICGKPFAAKASLRAHMKESHPGLFYCSVCFSAFTSRVHLNTHKSSCRLVLSCPECSSVFTDKLGLNRHRQAEHNVSGLATVFKNTEKKFPCSYCSSKFMQLSDLKRHLISHTGEKPFICKQCETGFTRKSSLTKHMRIHTGEKPYTCPNCSEDFSYRYQFNRHMKTH